MSTELASKPAVTKPAVTIEEQMATMQAEIIRLRGANKTVTVTVENSTLESAIAKLESEAALDLASENPKARPSLTLKTEAGDVIAPSKAQKELTKWDARKKAMVKAHSDKHRLLFGQRRANLQRLVKDPSATVATSQRVAKTDGRILSVGLRASRKALARKGKGLRKAKPAQLAAAMPVAGNAAKPAMVS